MAWRVRPLFPLSASLSFSHQGQRGIAVFYPDDMGRRSRPARDAPLDILRACRLALRPRATRIFPLVPPVVQRLESEDRRVVHRDLTGDRVRFRDLSRLAEYHRRYARPSCLSDFC